MFSGKILMPKLYNIGRVKQLDLVERYRELEKNGVCKFCPQNLLHEARHQVYLVEESWVVVHNIAPYKGSSLHLLMVPKRHVRDMLDLSLDELSAFWRVLGKLKLDFDLRDYGIGIRNGDPSVMGGTVAHLHAHIIVGNARDALRMRFNGVPD
jgi:ATP adenylyltransferase